MKKNASRSGYYVTTVIALLLFIACPIMVHGQHILAPDTVCVGDPVPFSLDSNTNFTTYAWEFGTNSLSPIVGTALPIPNTATSGNTSFTIVAQTTMVYDTLADKFYAFVTSASSGYTNPSVQRLSFGANPHSSPIATNLGNPGNAFIVASYANMEAVEIVLDETGVYHAFFTNRGIVHWVFGNGLDNPPTVVSRIFDNPAVMAMGMQMSVLKAGNQWVAFCGQAYGIQNIVRFDLGTNLNSLPASIPYTVLPAPTGGFNQAPCYFSLLKENGQWVMVVAPLGGTTTPLFRYNFGTNIQNNNPIATSLGSPAPAPMLNNRGLNFIKSCDSFYMLGLNQDGSLLSFNFQNNIASVPSTQSLGQWFGSNFNSQVLKPYWYNDTLWALTGNWNNNPTATVYRLPLLAIPSGNAAIKYYNPATTYTFTTPGVYDVMLYCDQADPRGPQAFCKQIVVTSQLQNLLSKDTTLCSGQSLQLQTNITGSVTYLWNTGATTPGIIVNQSGTYWVQTTGTMCNNGADTIEVVFNPLPDVSVAPENPVICKGQFVKLNASGPAGNYSWSPATFLDQPASNAPSANPPVTTRYYVTLTDNNGCTGTDSVTITVAPIPEVTINTEVESVNCDHQSVQLHVTGATHYQWEPAAYCDNPNSADPLVSPDVTTTFYVTGKNEYGCQNVDSVQIVVVKNPVFFVPNAFSPDQNGLNDIFIPIVYCDFSLSRFSVYNRYGQQVYNTAVTGAGWDGNLNGKKADVGTYFWYIEGKDSKGQKVTKKGDVQLIR